MRLVPGDPLRLRTAVWDAGRVHPLNRFEVVGPRPLCGERQAADLPADELRSSRTRGALGEETFRRVRRAEVTLVGCGRSGSQAAFQLVGMGVRRLRLVDGDLLGAENLDGMPGLTAADLGRFKAVALAARLRAFCPAATVSAVAASLPAEAAIRTVERPADLLVTCVDDDRPRLWAAAAARRTLTPHLDIATEIQADAAGRRDRWADVRLLLPGEGCVRCVGGSEAAEPPPADPADWRSERAGSLVAWNAVAVGRGLTLWADLLGGARTDTTWLRLSPDAAELMPTPTAPRRLPRLPHGPRRSPLTAADAAPAMTAAVNASAAAMRTRRFVSPSRASRAFLISGTPA